MDEAVEQLWVSLPSDTQAAARQLRAMVRSVVPEAFESVYHGALSYSLSPSVFDRLIYLSAEQTYVRLGFTFGIYLPDPGHNLVGEGKRMRHVKVYTIEQASQPELRNLIRAAWENGPKHVAEMKTSRFRKARTK